ncbi:MAG: LLM class F420-dependent oxidoreductase [Chloroflexota bacterium]|nr:LLM class F420-dependent oxidoreductase [Chloroflexota bacterium]NOG63769.1 LLM class F420-dependent oxidoreductase [Chloroflexota bacterium]GIK64997.1 MAG: LLM class F420-dependent oxidoreductase [Chloroflexota bacterium]
MAQIGIMIEGQHDLNWARWKRLLQAAEDLGYQCVFRSDHFTNANPPDYDSLELWVSLTYAATHTQKIEFGPLVTPVTFRHPSITIRMAAQVDDLSGGRLVLGMGAGWQEREHRLFGVPFYDVPTRFEMLTDALEMTQQLLHSDTPVTFKGKHFSLDEAILLPRPERKGGPPILIGGRGPKRTLPLAAKYADEWNAVFIPLEQFKERNTLLDQLLDERGRSRQSVKRSLMTQVVYEPTDAELSARLAGKPSVTELINDRGLIVGTGSAVVDQIGAWVEAGIERFMLQWMDLDNIDDLEKMARDVLPHFHRA